MKKPNILLAFLLCLSASAWAITPKDINSYATRLTLPNGATMTNAHTVDVKFYVMAPTKGVWVYLDADDNGSFETTIFEDSNLELGKNEYKTVTCTLPQSLAPGEYRWAVKVQGKESHSGWSVPQPARDYENDDKRYLFGQAMGVAVDCSYDSPYFGYSYVTESHGRTTTEVKFSDGKTYSRKTKDGIYMFGPAMGVVNNGDAYTGGVSWCTESKYYEHGPFRVCTDDEGYVYVCENLRSADYPDDILVRRMHPSDLTKNLEAVLMQSHVPSGIAERVHSIAVTRNANRQKVLYAILGGTTSTGVLTENSGRLCSFILDDTGNSISITHQRTVNLYTAGLISIYTSIVPGTRDGDLWVAQHRGSKDGNPVLIHIDNAGTIDYTLSSNTRFNLRGAVALSKDGSIIAIPTIYDSKHVVRCYQVSYGSTNVSLTGLYNIQIPIMNSYTGNEFVESMAFDVANNLYFVSGNNSDQGVDRLYVYALPKSDNLHTTPARSALPIIVPGQEIIWHPYPTRPSNFATDAAYNEWIGDTFSTAVTPGYTPPTITRDGYIFAGWYYGNATTYDIYDPYNSSAPKGGHLWARWIKATFEEGYITASLASDSYSQQEIEAGMVNRNMELASYLSQNPSYLPSNLKVNRKLQGGMYNTFMLPFTLTSSLRANIIDSEGKPLAEDAILTMQNVTSHTTNGETLYELVFESADEVPAYQPFLIKPTNDLTATITFPNVPSVEALPVQPAAEIEGVRFVPVFEPTMIGGEESNILILVADNRLAKLNGVGEMLGLRGYFDAGNAFSSASYAIKIVDRGGVVTYIGDITTPQKGSVATKILHNNQIYILRGDEVYTITGNRVR